MVHAARARVALPAQPAAIVAPCLHPVESLIPANVTQMSTFHSMDLNVSILVAQCPPLGKKRRPQHPFMSPCVVPEALAICDSHWPSRLHLRCRC